MQNRGFISLIGFLLFIIGFLSIFLSLVGLKLTYIGWIHNLFGRGLAFVIYILMIIIGVVMVYISRQRIEE